MRIFRLRVGFVVLLALLPLAGCGGNEKGTTGETPGGQLAVSAKDFEFSPKELKVPAGKEVTVKFTNNGTVAHTFTLEEDRSVDTGSVQPGESKTVTFKGPDEETDFICTIHYESKGMEGKIEPE